MIRVVAIGLTTMNDDDGCITECACMLGGSGGGCV